MNEPALEHGTPLQRLRWAIENFDIARSDHGSRAHGAVKAVVQELINSSTTVEQMSHSFETGDIVAGSTMSTLHCGSGYYADAVVVSAKPLVLVSRETDMLWSSTVDDMILHKVGQADPELLQRCMKRFLHDYTRDYRP